MMNFRELKETAEANGCDVRENEPLSLHTNFGIGGTARLFIDMTMKAAVPVFECIRKNGIPYTVLGKGANVLFSDEHHEIAVIHMGKLCEAVRIEGDTIYAQAGANLAGVCITARDKGLTGLEFAYGIPATIGGACYMNAGAYGGQMSDVITSVTALCPDGTLREFSADETGYGYRKSIFMTDRYIILSARMQLSHGDTAEIGAKMNELMQRRQDKQPLEFRSAGSTFKRPAGAFAGALIEQCGLKGYSVGDAQVSEKHAGFVINRGHASYEDVMAVIKHVQATVLRETGYELECEVQIF